MNNINFGIGDNLFPISSEQRTDDSSHDSVDEVEQGGSFPEEGIKDTSNDDPGIENLSKENDVIDELNKCISSITNTNIDLGHINRVKDSVAFMVEAYKKLYPESWKDELKHIRDYLKANGTDSKKSSWYLHENISLLYQLALEENEKSAQIFGDKSAVKRIHQIRVLSGAYRQAMKKMHEKGNPVSVPPIVNSFIPKWHKNL